MGIHTSSKAALTISSTYGEVNSFIAWFYGAQRSLRTYFSGVCFACTEPKPEWNFRFILQLRTTTRQSLFFFSFCWLHVPTSYQGYVLHMSGGIFPKIKAKAKSCHFYLYWPSVTPGLYTFGCSSFILNVAQSQRMQNQVFPDSTIPLSIQSPPHKKCQLSKRRPTAWSCNHGRLTQHTKPHRSCCAKPTDSVREPSSGLTRTDGISVGYLPTQRPWTNLRGLSW